MKKQQMRHFNFLSFLDSLRETGISSDIWAEEKSAKERAMANKFNENMTNSLKMGK